jgi:hypothetical protein
MPLRVRQGRAEELNVNAESPQHLTGGPLDIEHTEQHVLARDDIGAVEMSEAGRSTERTLSPRRPSQRPAVPDIESGRHANGFGHLDPGRGQGDAGRRQPRGRVAPVGQQPEEQVLGADTIMTEFPRLALSQDHRVRGGVVEPLPGCRTHDLSAHASIVADQLGGGGWTQTTSTTIMAVVPPTRRDCGGANDADVARTELASLAPDSLLSATTAGHRCDGGGRRRQW